jgi:STE24 endopeptidase
VEWSGGLNAVALAALLLFVVSVFGLLAQPLVNTLSRLHETAVDRYSLETVDPSVERRVRAAMEWKAAHGTTDEPAVPRS